MYSQSVYVMCQGCKIVPGTGVIEVNKKDKIPSLMKPTIWRVRNINKGGREESERRNSEEGKKKEGRKLFLY